MNDILNYWVFSGKIDSLVPLDGIEPVLRPALLPALRLASYATNRPLSPFTVHKPKGVCLEHTVSYCVQENGAALPGLLNVDCVANVRK